MVGVGVCVEYVVCVGVVVFVVCLCVYCVVGGGEVVEVWYVCVVMFVLIVVRRWLWKFVCGGCLIVGLSMCGCIFCMCGWMICGCCCFVLMCCFVGVVLWFVVCCDVY